MKKFFKDHWRPVSLAIFISIAGTALWENLLRDFFNFIIKILLTVSTLGVEKYKNQIYEDISRGFYEGASIFLLSLILGSFIGLAAGVLSRKNNNENEGQNPIRKLFKTKENLKTFLIIYLIVLAIVSTLTVARITYVNKSIAYYNQLLKIVSPSLSIEDRVFIESQFAQINTKEEYIQIIENLEKIVRESDAAQPQKPSFIF